MSNVPATALPWKALRHTEGDIPWEALEQFATALAANPTLWEQLREAYDMAVDHWYDRGTYECYYIPAIFALAAPRLDAATRAAIGRFLVDELSVAADNDEDDLIEVLSGAIGSMGPAVLPVVLEAIDRRRRYHEAWFSLWGLTVLAASCNDTALRERVAARCRKALEEADRGRFSSLEICPIAYTLAKMGCTDALPLMRRLQKRDPHPDLEKAMDIMEGKPDPFLNDEVWSQPVRQWLPVRWKRLQKWYDNLDAEEDGDNDDEDEEDEEEEEQEEEGSEAERRARQLIEQFARSPIAKALPRAAYDDAEAIADWLLYYARNYCDAEPEQIDEFTLREVLLEIFPRKISAEPDTFHHVVPVVQAFLRWLASRGMLPDGERLARLIGPWAGRVVAAAADPSNWGMAKSLVMQAMKEGVDVEDPGEFNKFCMRYNERILAQKQLEAEPEKYFFGDDAEADDLPTVNLAPHTVHVPPTVGRNDPCPCGSGKKFKKCCAKKRASEG